ncbi:hypothetical protein [Marinobacter sp.]|uniref:hypothetical protein n=1 Tax=Marinobacter sp. TaxID=50741 RepID=UPI002B492D5A|nr:hypothetical protein [Marinobacter sp.]HKK55483.1 hypothetical protein [Marinobacter sp.]
MREMMQKALSAMNARRGTKASGRRTRYVGADRSQPASSEDWGMSPEDALKATMVSGYK